MPHLRSISLTVLLALAASQAYAQVTAVTKSGDKTAAAKPAAPTPDSTDITVTGKRPEVTDSIDRRVYDVKNDPDAQTGLAADVLAKLPSLQVSQGGKLSLRGDPNVRLLVDGKPPINGSQALQTMAAADIDRVEVMTNPSAQFAPDGTAGIVNIITRRQKTLGVKGNLTARFNTLGQNNFALSSAVTTGPWTVTGTLGYQVVPNLNHSDSVQTLPFASTQTSRSANTSETTAAGVKAAYKLSDNAILSLSVDGSGMHSTSQSTSRYVSASRSYDSVFTSGAFFANHRFDLNYDYDDTASGTHATLDASTASSRQPYRSLTTDTYANGQMLYGSDNVLSSSVDDLKGDYERRLSNGQIARAGFDIYKLGYDSMAAYFDRGSIAGPQPDGTKHRLRVDRTVISTYVTWQLSLGKWKVLPGLRAEREQLDIRSEGIHAARDSLLYFPSLHLSHPLSDLTKLNLSYSRRLDRVPTNLYDPFVRGDGITYVYMGNPDLKPTQTDAWEAEYNYSKGSRNYAAAIYYRATHDDLQSDFSTVRSDGIIVRQPINAGRSHSGGIELTARAPLSAHWKYTFNANLLDHQLPAAAGQRRDVFEYNGNGTLEYDAPAKGNNAGGDQYQLTAVVGGRQHTLQGYSDGGSVLGATWQHPVTAKLVLVVSVSDLLRSNVRSVVDAPNLRSSWRYYPRTQALRIAFSYKYGAKK